ncbi:MAG: carboxylating nicotinate-nucleotide diphosphorylase [Gammaproteobacteria bacterium]|nr:carboxylating nicotinate-nucleotide diphosphorylase [Gammaproteobacteria bacterium]NNJ77937.1 carboxylating nicotinate-nucleotide diphosphorylase [Xanthomonadales bacterium]
MVYRCCSRSRASAQRNSRTFRVGRPKPTEAVVQTDVRRALSEDVDSGDCTAALVPADARLDTRVICRETAVLAGRPWFDETFRQLDCKIAIEWSVDDGAAIGPDQEVCRLHGPARAVLTGERTALNFLQTLSGTATRTREYVDAIAGTGAEILDTRKTLPGLRHAQKYAVLCGGGRNHRIGLWDAILVKENHIAAAGSIPAAVARARQDQPELLLEVEVETLAQLDQAFESGAQRVLLDNFPIERLREAVKRYKGRIGLEASGGIELDTIRVVAETGVDFISTGDITKSVRAVDFSMRFA